MRSLKLQASTCPLLKILVVTGSDNISWGYAQESVKNSLTKDFWGVSLETSHQSLLQPQSCRDEWLLWNVTYFLKWPSCLQNWDWEHQRWRVLSTEIGRQYCLCLLGNKSQRHIGRYIFVAKYFVEEGGSLKASGFLSELMATFGYSQQVGKDEALRQCPTVY